MPEAKRYKVTCCSCKKDIYVTKSIFHEMGLFDLGSGNCAYCNTFLNFKYDPKEDSIKSRLYADFEKEMKEGTISD